MTILPRNNLFYNKTNDLLQYRDIAVCRVAAEEYNPQHPSDTPSIKSKPLKAKNTRFIEQMCLFDGQDE